MSPYKQLQEATAEELLSYADVRLIKKQEKGWVKAINITAKDGQTFDVRLFWNDDDGFYVSRDEPVSAELWQIMEKPEFEYILDSLTSDEDYSLYNIVELVRKYNDGVEGNSLAPTAEATLDLISTHLRKMGFYA